MFSTATSRVWSVIALVITLQACGKSKDGHDPEPISPSVEITGKSQSGDETIVSFQSAQANAKYECRVDRGNQPGIWTECDDKTFAFKNDSNVEVKFNVRAKNGELVSEVQSILIPKDSSTSAFTVSIVEKNNTTSANLGNGTYQISFYAAGTDSQTFSTCAKPIIENTHHVRLHTRFHSIAMEQCQTSRFTQLIKIQTSKVSKIRFT